MQYGYLSISLCDNVKYIEPQSLVLKIYELLLLLLLYDIPLS